MKATFVRDDMRYSGDAPYPEGVTVRKHRKKMLPMWDKGAVINSPDCYRLVQMGVCEPADAECRDAACRTDEEMKESQHAYERQRRGIRSEDHHRYDRGEISHVLPNGEYAPGPNWSLYNEPTADNLFDEGEEDDDE